VRPWSTRELCEVHEHIHRERPTGDAARRALRRLRWYLPLLLILPPGNIRIRHHLTVAGLLHSLGEGAPWKHVGDATRMLRSLCDGPYLEGWSYLLYSRAAYHYLVGECAPIGPLDELFREQELHAATMSMADGSVPTTDTARGALAPRVEGWEQAMFATCDAYTVRRNQGGYTLVHHDRRLRGWRARLNLHVGMHFGRVVREAGDWDWYTGWPEKKIGWRDLWWRVWPPSMEVEGKSTREVVVSVGGKKSVVTL
jgi:hypothetical protein